MRIIKKAKIVLFIAGVICINQLLSFCLCPIGGASEVMWRDYGKTEEIDTVYVGSSVCLRAFDPYTIDELLGTESFNMGTPSQPLQQSYLSVKTAIKEHKLKRVVLGLGYFSLNAEADANALIANWQASKKHAPITEKIRSALEIMLSKSYRNTEDSINFFCPWIYNRVALHRSDIVNNVKQKLAGKTADDDKMVNDEQRQYVGRGFGYYKGTVDFDKVGNKNSKTTYDYGEQKDAYGFLGKIVKLCKKNNVELVVIHTPHPVFDVISYGEEYFVKYDRLKDFFNEKDVDYYDFNLAKPELYESRNEYYSDFEHLNKEGAEVFSKAFAALMKMRSENVDLEQYFYDKDAYLDSINYITNTWFDATQSGAALTLQAGAYHGNNVSVEYEFEAVDPVSGEYQTIQEYSESNVCTIDAEQYAGQTVTFRVNVRQPGSEEAFEHYYESAVVIP